MKALLALLGVLALAALAFLNSWSNSPYASPPPREWPHERLAPVQEGATLGGVPQPQRASE